MVLLQQIKGPPGVYLYHRPPSVIYVHMLHPEAVQSASVVCKHSNKGKVRSRAGCEYEKNGLGMQFLSDEQEDLMA